MEKYNLKNDTITESQLHKFHIYPKYHRDSKIYSNKGFINIDNGSRGGTHWNCFIINDNK